MSAWALAEVLALNRTDFRVVIGQRYRAIRPDGTPSTTVQEVIAIYRSLGGIEHACLRQVNDPTETRTLATSVIAERARFVPEDPNLNRELTEKAEAVARDGRGQRHSH